MTDNKIENFSEHQLRKTKADLEKDEEIRKMQAMIQQMQSQLNQTPSITSIDDTSTTV